MEGTKLDLSKLPIVITLKNTSEVPVGFRYFRVNFTEVMQPADEIIISAQSSEEAAYYLALNDAKIGLSVTQAEASEPSQNG